MKGTWKRGLIGALSVMLLCFLPAQALNWDGSSSGGSESTNVGNGGFGIADSVAANNVVGYRFSVVDDSGKTIYASKDIFRNTTNGNRAMGSEGRRFYRFRSKYNKEQLIDRQNQGFSTEYTLTNSYRESQMGFTSALPVPSGLETWQNSGTNMNRVLKLWNSSTNALIYGSKVLVEPIIIVQIKHTWHVLTVTELALTGKAMFGAWNNGGSSSNSGSWGFIAAYTNKHFPNLLYASQGYGIWTGVGALSRQATFYDIINKGYGVGVAYTQKQNKVYTLTINYYSNGASSGTVGGVALDTLSAGKNVFVRTAVVYSNAKYSSGLANYTDASSSYLSLQRDGYQGTGYWGTTTSGGTQVHQDTGFASGAALAKALGVDISKGNKTVNVYAQWQGSLALEPIEPNAPYRETTEVITSYWLINDSDKAYTPDDRVTLRFEVLQANGTLVQSITQENVVVPAHEKNLVYIKWKVPEGLAGANITIRVSQLGSGATRVLASRDYATVAYTMCQTPDTQFEYQAPGGTGGEAPREQSGVVTWSQFVYENGRFVDKRYQFSLLSQNMELEPNSPTASKQGGVWTMKSGYGFSCSGQPTQVGLPQAGYLQPGQDAYTMPQYVYALYPEYGYTYGEMVCTTLTRGGNPTFPEFLDYGKVHFTPIWYPNGAYTVAVVSRDCWTPAGMVQATSTQTIQIQGSAYDDWYIGRFMKGVEK